MYKSVAIFAARHAAASVVTVASLCALWTIFYFLLLLWAMVFGGGLGGPLAYPAGLVLTLLAGTIAVAVFLFPSAGIAEVFARHRAWPILVQIPFCFLILASLCLAIGSFLAVKNQETSVQGLWNSSLLFGFNLIPLGIYCWTMQSGPLLVRFWRFLMRLIEQRTTASTKSPLMDFLRKE